MQHIVIIGNGIAGVTTARHVRKRSDSKITIISGETDHFYSRTALMYIYMGHMKYEHTKPYEDWFWDKNRIELVRGWVQTVDFDDKTVKMEDGAAISYDQLVIATGSKSNKFGWPGQDLEGVQGLYNMQDLELMERNSAGIQRAVVVGGGLIGIEMAEMFHSRHIPVTYLVRETHFWNGVIPNQEAQMIDRHIVENGIDLRLATELREIVDDGNGRVQAVITNQDETIDCQFVGLTVGVSPNVDFLKDTALDIERGVMVNEYLETNIPDVYAAGDCAQRRVPIQNRRPIEAVWYTGRMMAESLAKTLTGEKTAYDPGWWFNSAKFFDIEYQTYGHVWAQLKEGEAEFYWEHASGKKCMHFVFDKESRKFLGVNNFGIRLRHHSFNQWLQEGRSIEYVMEHLKDANFDPEFYKAHEKEILDQFNAENGTSIHPKTKSWKRIFSYAYTETHFT
ncbi:MAG: FAD-dependent oxidoreductase [Bacteroidota bacterium]